MISICILKTKSWCHLSLEGHKILLSLCTFSSSNPLSLNLLCPWTAVAFPLPHTNAQPRLTLDSHLPAYPLLFRTARPIQPQLPWYITALDMIPSALSPFPIGVDFYPGRKNACHSIRISPLTLTVFERLPFHGFVQHLALQGVHIFQTLLKHSTEANTFSFYKIHYFLK